MSQNHQETIELLRQSYAMEIETVINYLANSTNLDGVRAEQIKKSLADDILEEIEHAQLLGRRIKQLGGTLPGSASLPLGQQVQPPHETTDVAGVIRGVIAAEESACDQYYRIINAISDHDPVTADLCTRLLTEEEEHLVLFRGFLREYEAEHNQQPEASGHHGGKAMYLGEVLTANEVHTSDSVVVNLS